MVWSTIRSSPSTPFRRSSSARSVPRHDGWCPARPGADTRVAIGLGANVGDRLDALAGAVTGLDAIGRVVARSSIYETAPIGPDQPDYLNAVVVLDTILGPRPLLATCLEIERALGRERRERWGPRVIDLDVLLYSDAVLDMPGLTVPHPRMHERRFVLEPLAEAWPGVEVPGRGPVEELLSGVSDHSVSRTELEW